MPRLSFKTDWVEADGVRGPELAATWSALEIRVDDSIVTRVLDNRAQSVRNFVYVPVYPFAEWLATNWWFLTHEINSPVKDSDSGFHSRHVIGAAREGYAFPALQMFPQGGSTYLVWSPDESLGTSVEFLGAGEAWIDSDEFRDSCADLIDRVVQRLLAVGVEGTLLEEEWSAIQEADTDEVEFCKTAARIGWDPYDVDDNQRSLVLGLAGKLGSVALEEATSVFSAQNLMQECAAITGALGRAKANGLFWERLGSINQETLIAEPARAPTPWQVGYGLAQELRRTLDLDGTPLPSMEQIAKAIGEKPALLNGVTEPVDLRKAALVDGVITSDDDRNPAFAFREFSYAEDKRFHFCRALGEALVSPGMETLLTKESSERQQRSRAFAAEFLAPSSGLRQRVSGRVVDGDDIDELALMFGVSSRVIAHQVRNHGIARVWDMGPSVAP